MEQAEEIALKIPTGDTRLGRKIVELDEVGKTFHGKRLFSDLTLGLVAGDRASRWTRRSTRARAPSA